jgi:hypothetical protein
VTAAPLLLRLCEIGLLLRLLISEVVAHLAHLLQHPPSQASILNLFCSLLSLSMCLQVLQRLLPRPSSIQGLPQPKAHAELAAMSLRERAEAELFAELAALVEHDNAAYPVAKDGEGKSKKDKKRRAK